MVNWKGLSEFYCLLIITFSIYFFLKFELNYKNILLLSSYQLLVRGLEEHIFLYGSLIFIKCKFFLNLNFVKILLNFINTKYSYLFY